MISASRPLMAAFQRNIPEHFRLIGTNLELGAALGRFLELLNL